MSPGTSHRLKWLTLASLAVNTALLAWLFRPGVPPRSAAQETASHDQRQRVTLVTNTVTTIRDLTPATPRFDWSLVESTDYEVYIANLRRLDMPDWLIRELILAELRHHYQMRELDVPGAGPAHWLTYREARDQRRRRAEALWAIKLEERAAQLRLVGTYRHPDAEEALEEGHISLIFGSMTPDQAMDAISELAFVKERAEFMKQLHNGLFSRADEQLLLTTYESARAHVASRVSAPLFEEFYLRLQIVLAGLLDDFSFPGVQLTGAQLRELVRIRSGLIDPVRWELTEADKPGPAERNQLNRQVQTALADTMGDEVASQFARSQDPAFRAVHQLTQQHELPVERAIAVYDIRQATINEVRSLVSSTEIDDFEKWEMRQFIQQEAEQAVQSTLGPTAWEDYRANAGRWMDRIGGPPPDANTGGGR